MHSHGYVSDSSGHSHQKKSTLESITGKRGGNSGSFEDVEDTDCPAAKSAIMFSRTINIDYEDMPIQGCQESRAIQRAMRSNYLL